ncbi:hypothetical protein ARMSODRAFT_94490 [Armillaria solidipes]|uniref:Uncharacterized protein n=1 Tax=Armillaria solidipes TaxID=1076256 RepID=A0A2H3BV48_9AGAR|nr:hypothetical protein ARMSODRAFT_94490 [Armillaria solidipes]
MALSARIHRARIHLFLSGMVLSAHCMVLYYGGISPRPEATTLTKTWPPADSSRCSKRACVITMTLDRWRPSSNHKLRQKNLSFVSPSLCCISVLSASIP